MAGEPRGEVDQKVRRKVKKEKKEKKEKKKHKKEKKERKEAREHKKRKHKHRRHAEPEIKDEKLRHKKKRVKAEPEPAEEESAGEHSEQPFEEEPGEEEEVKAMLKHAEEEFPPEESLGEPEKSKGDKKREAKLQQALLHGGHDQVLDMRTSELLARQLVDQISEAIIKDNELNRNDKLALNKLTFAKQMVQELKKVHIQEEFLRQSGLDALGKWISKMPDGNYPCYNVIEVGLECLQFLPITTENLRESKVGAIVKRLARDTKSDKMKRACTAIIEKWYRMIFNLDNGYDPDGAYEEQYRAYLHDKQRERRELTRQASVQSANSGVVEDFE